MRIGISLRNMGPQSQVDTLVACARAADDGGLDSLWVADHVAIPPDQAEGSDGRYLDPLATLAFLAGHTARIGLGVGVLVLPYRPALPTAKWVATVQEVSRGRLLLGVGAGWMEPEFRALGIPRRRRGALTDETLELLDRCFTDDEVEWNGQRFLFRPRPARPPILVGGAPPHALERALRYRAGWMPMGGEPEKLRAPIARLRADAAAAGAPVPEVVVLTALPLDDPARAHERVAEFTEVGATRIVHGMGRYTDAEAYRGCVEALAKLTDARPPSGTPDA